MSEPERREGDHSTEVEESPVPSQGERFGFNLGNPVESEGAAFSWLIMVIFGALSVALIAKLISTLAGMIWLAILLLIVALLIVRGLRYELGSPDDDE